MYTTWVWPEWVDLSFTEHAIVSSTWRLRFWDGSHTNVVLFGQLNTDIRKTGKWLKHVRCQESCYCNKEIFSRFTNRNHIGVLHGDSCKTQLCTFGLLGCGVFIGDEQGWSPKMLLEPEGAGFCWAGVALGSPKIPLLFPPGREKKKKKKKERAWEQERLSYHSYTGFILF